MELTSVPLSTTRAVRPRRRASMAQARPTGPAPMTTTSRGSRGRSGIRLFYRADVMHLAVLRLAAGEPSFHHFVDHDRRRLHFEEHRRVHLHRDQDDARVVRRALTGIAARLEPELPVGRPEFLDRRP